MVGCKKRQAFDNFYYEKQLVNLEQVQVTKYDSICNLALGMF